MEEIYDYDFFGHAVLSDAEIAWFHTIVDTCKQATKCETPIIAYNHDLYSGKSKDALGCCITENIENPITGNPIITIDTWFIHEKYEQLFGNLPSITPETLEEVIAHEIAHLYCWRHGKKHNRITADIIDKIRKER